MFKLVILPLDGSENSERSVEWVRRLARPETAMVVLVRAVPPEQASPRAMEEARQYLMRFEREMNYSGIPARVVVRKGSPVKVILRTAMTEGAGLIVMSSRGGSKVTRWLLGGVTEQVLRLSPIPALVVRARTAFPRKGRIRRIILPVDGSKLAERSIPWVGRLAKYLSAKVVFFHARQEGSLRAAEEYASLRKRVVTAELDLKRRGVGAEFAVVRGDAASEILRIAKDGDLVATTTHGYGGAKRWLFGSVAEKVIREAAVPVIAFKTPDQVWPRILYKL